MCKKIKTPILSGHLALHAVEELPPLLAVLAERPAEALEAVADAIVDSDGLRDTVAEIAQFKSAKQQLDQVPDVRADAVERARELAGNGFYTQRDALEGTADGLINEIA